MDEDELLSQLEQERGPDSHDTALFRRVQLGQSVKAFAQGRADPKTCADVVSYVCHRADQELESLEQQWSYADDPGSEEVRKMHVRAHGLRLFLSWLDEAITQGIESEHELESSEGDYHE